MIFEFFGRIRKGKTFSAIYLAKAFLEKDKKAIVISNLKLNNIKYMPYTQFVEEYDKIIEDDNNKIFILDEGYLRADSRRSGSKKNIDFTDVVLQSGKNNIDIILTSQLYNQPDVRIRYQCEFFIEPILNKSTKSLEWKIYKTESDILYGNIFKTLKIKNIKIDKFFEEYNTKEIIKR